MCIIVQLRNVKFMYLLLTVNFISISIVPNILYYDFTLTKFTLRNVNYTVRIFIFFLNSCFVFIDLLLM